MDEVFIAAFADELEKIGFIYGAQEPEHPFSTSSNIPYPEREKDYIRYAKEKSMEGPTPWWKALVGGGAVGGIGGGLIGGSFGAGGGGRGALVGALIGAGIGTGLGMLTGAGLRQADVAEIEHTKRMATDREGRKYYINAGIGSREAWERDADREARIEAARETGRAIGEGIKDR